MVFYYISPNFPFMMFTYPMSRKNGCYVSKFNTKILVFICSMYPFPFVTRSMFKNNVNRNAHRFFNISHLLVNNTFIEKDYWKTGPSITISKFYTFLNWH